MRKLLSKFPLIEGICIEKILITDLPHMQERNLSDGRREGRQADDERDQLAGRPQTVYSGYLCNDDGLLDEDDEANHCCKIVDMKSAADNGSSVSEPRGA